MRLRSLLIAAVLAWPMTQAPVMAQQDGTSLDDVEKATLDAAKTLGDYAADRKDEGVAKAREMMETLDGRIERLREKIRDSSGEARDRMQGTLSRLEWKRAKLAARMEELEESSSKAWEDVKRGFISAYEELESAYDDARAKFEK